MRLKEIRVEHALSQLSISKKLKIARGTYCQWELERDLMPINRLNDFCNLFKVSIDYVLGFSDIVQYNNARSRINLRKSGERLRRIRLQNKLTQDKLAQKFAIDRSLISKYEKGYNVVSTTFLIEYMKLYNISGDYLLGKIDDCIKLKEKEIL